MILTYNNYLNLKSALIKYFVDNQIKPEKNRSKQFLVDCNLCKDLNEAKIINKMLLDKDIPMLQVIDKIIFIHFVNKNVLFENANKDVQRLAGKTIKDKWKFYKYLYKV